MPITMTAAINGTPDDQDIRAGEYAIEIENIDRANRKPPESPLPYRTVQELAASYLIVINNELLKRHKQYRDKADQESIANVRSLWQSATDAQRTAAIEALT